MNPPVYRRQNFHLFVYGDRVGVQLLLSHFSKSIRVATRVYPPLGQIVDPYASGIKNHFIFFACSIMRPIF